MVVSGAELNSVDYIFISIFTGSILLGLMRGLFREVLSLIVFGAAFIVASMYANSLAAHFTGAENVQHAMDKVTEVAGSGAVQPISYIALAGSFSLLFFGTLIAGAFINYFLSFIFQATVLGLGNRLLGGVFGLVRAFIISLALTFVVQLTAYGEEESWRHSRLVGLFQPAAIKLSGVVSPKFKELKGKFGVS